MRTRHGTICSGRGRREYHIASEEEGIPHSYTAGQEGIPHCSKADEGEVISYSCTAGEKKGIPHSYISGEEEGISHTI
jgi:hypothetical protein